MTRVLLTNDDGHAADGLHAARRELLAAGHAVTTIAPDGNRSGTGRRVTCHGTVAVERVDGDDDAPIFACDGSPVDCVRVGLLADRFPPAEIVVAGINHGVNMGDDATYSGTLGAALEAALLGVSGLAVSQQDRARDLTMLSTAGHDFDLAWLTPHLVVAALAAPAPPRVAANVNLPNPLRDRAVEVTRLGRLSYAGRWMRPVETIARGWTFHAYLGRDDPHPALELAEGTDTGALTRGRLSITPLSLDWASNGSAARAWGRRLADALGRELATTTRRSS